MGDLGKNEGGGGFGIAVPSTRNASKAIIFQEI